MKLSDALNNGLGWNGVNSPYDFNETMVKIVPRFRLLILANNKQFTDNQGNIQCSTGCPFNYEPRCASNHKTYDNKCLMEIAECQLGHKLKLVRMGRCQK